MDELDVSTVVRVSPERAFEFLLDFAGYAQYTEYLKEVRRNGDGGVGTTYEMVLSWWLVSYTARSRVVGIEEPSRIDWVLEDSLEAEGAWLVEELGPEESRIRLRASFERDSVNDAGLGLPGFVSGSGVLQKVAPVARTEATTVLARIVADLEGEPREVDIDVHSRPDFLE